MARKAIPIGSCLSTLLDDTNRMMPFMGTIVYNLETKQSCSLYLRHVLSTFSTGARTKRCHILCLENIVDPQRFITQNRIDLNDNISILEDDKLDSISIEKLPGNKTENVLIIDSLLPILLSSSDEYEKTVHKTMLCLRRLQSTFAHILVLHSTDIMVYEKSLETSLRQISNTIIDFRREAGLDSGVTCQLNDSSIHVHITVKKKHPRTHLKVSSQHEHFDVHPQTNKIIKYHSGPQVRKNILAKFQPEIKPIPQESSIEKLVPFSLSLKESEQKAKDELVLPYMRKQEIDTKQNKIEDSKTSGGGQVIYHYDKFDDFDEDDDPDDDLDF